MQWEGRVGSGQAAPQGPKHRGEHSGSPVHTSLQVKAHPVLSHRTCVGVSHPYQTGALSETEAALSPSQSLAWGWVLGSCLLKVLLENLDITILDAALSTIRISFYIKKKEIKKIPY